METLDQLITTSGYSASSFSSGAKEELNRILQTAGYSALQGVLAYLNVRAAGVASATQTTQTTLDDKAVAEARAELEAREADKRKRRQGMYYLLAGVLAIGAVLAVLIIRHNRKQQRHG